MQIFKRIALVLVILIALPFIAALFIEKEFVVQREVVINKPKAEVFSYVKLLKNQLNYSKWFQIDPQMKTSYRGTDGTVGFAMDWDSNDPDVGQGEMEIKNVSDGDRIDMEIRMTKPFLSTDPTYTTTEAIGQNQTKVKSVYSGKMDYPMNLIGIFCIGKIGQDMQTGLDNLKRVLEK